MGVPAHFIILWKLYFGKILWKPYFGNFSMGHIFCTILWKRNQFIVQMHGPNECH